MLVETTEQAMKARQSKARGSTTSAQRAKTFNSKIMRGELRSALRYISDTECGGLLYPDDTDDKSQKSVGEVLQDKHPRMRDPGPAAMKHYDELPDFIDLDITCEHVENVAKKMSGSSGLSGFDSSALKNVLLMHGQASSRLRVVIAQFCEWLSNETPPFAAFRAALANRLIAMDKSPGVRPVGIGDVWRRLIAKCVLVGAGHSATTSCGSDQLCAGLRAGTDGAIHGISTLYDELEASDSDSGFLLIDANNAFNEINRINMLWTIRHEWPAGARFAYNCYSHHSLLIVRNPGGIAIFIFSKEGVTQGDPIAMFCYGIGILPMIRQLKTKYPELRQPWYADDAGALGSFDDIIRMFTELMKIGPDFGYFPNPSKSILITPTSKLDYAEQHFNHTYDLGVSVCSGHRYLGGFIGDTASRDDYISSKISSWTQTVKQLSMVALEKYSHSAYTGYTKSLQHQWTFLQRVIPNIDAHFQPLEEMITSSFLPALFGKSQDSISDIRTLLALPVKLAGLAVPDPVSTCAANYQSSTVMSSHLLLAVQEKITFNFQDHNDTCRAALVATRAEKQLSNESKLSTFLTSLPPPVEGNPSIGRAIGRARDTGMWLSTIPTNFNGSVLGNEEFQDGLCLRYMIVPNNLPVKCDGCNSDFSVTHAHQCRKGGLIIRRHDEINYELANLMKLAFKKSTIRAEPRIFNGSPVTDSENPNPTIDASGERGDLLVRGFWENGMDAIIDVRCVDTDAKSYNRREPEKVLKSAEKVKKTKYLEHCLQQRRAFTPFVISVDGLLGYEAKNLLKRLAFHLAEKWQKPYSVTCGFVKSRISLACVRATHQCLRGSRTPFRTISREIQWEDGAGTGIYRIDRQ
jgi:hypothetical protein